MMPGVFRRDDKPVCDFCSSPDVVKEYKCKNFASVSDAIGITYAGHGVTLESIGTWFACGECSIYIDTMDIEGLVNRACGAFSTKYCAVSPELRNHVAYTYELFFTNKIN